MLKQCMLSQYDHSTHSTTTVRSQYDHSSGDTVSGSQYHHSTYHSITTVSPQHPHTHSTHTPTVPELPKYNHSTSQYSSYGIMRTLVTVIHDTSQHPQPPPAFAFPRTDTDPPDITQLETGLSFLIIYPRAFHTERQNVFVYFNSGPTRIGPFTNVSQHYIYSGVPSTCFRSYERANEKDRGSGSLRER